MKLFLAISISSSATMRAEICDFQDKQTNKGWQTFPIIGRRKTFRFSPSKQIAGGEMKDITHLL